jgi:hypothetical protein
LKRLVLMMVQATAAVPAAGRGRAMVRQLALSA